MKAVLTRNRDEFLVFARSNQNAARVAKADMFISVHPTRLRTTM